MAFKSPKRLAHCWRTALKKTLSYVLVAVMAMGAGPAVTQTSKQVLIQDVYKQPVAGLSSKQLKQFPQGEKVFNNFWMAVNNPLIPLTWDLSLPGPSGGEWGLGPTFLATNCAACHVNAGRGRMLDSGGLAVQQVLRISVPGEDAHGGPKPDPKYGTDIQMFDIVTRKDPNQRAGEAEVFVDWVTQKFSFADGEELELRKPKVRVENLNFGPLAEGTMLSLRNAQAMVGMGYLEAISDKDILALAQMQKELGLNGRPNYVRDDIKQKTALGRFGWKANQPTVRQQIASAFAGDMGITSSLYPDPNCTAVQKECLEAIRNPKPELRPEMWEAITNWTLSLEVPQQRNKTKPEVKRGEQLFADTGCGGCHVSELRTGKFDAIPSLSNKTIRPFTDLLLHDMGPDLADGRPDFKASGSDWRTPPLWGIGLSKQVSASTNFLHDGRARNLTEAIVWHGGEAKPAKDKFVAMSKAQRTELLEFLNSL
jgi:CxxC motif-containing protein (DUF1111 family)